MEGGLEVMTDKQWEGVLLMVRGMAEKCTTAEEVVKFIDSVLDGRQKTQRDKAEK
ncbi:MAG: hypothetical protein FWG71_02030 [Synergistaceae bacterium]|nr:hypothetical protein [Synergistaceae bacterium]